MNTIIAPDPLPSHRRLSRHAKPSAALAMVMLLLLGFPWPVSAGEGDFTEPNPRIDFTAFLIKAQEAERVREHRRLSEERFIAMSRSPEVVVLDARSKERYDQLHIQGAINIPFPDLSEVTLAQRLPDKNRIILIYCNNNFIKAPKAFESKGPAVSLNISTFITLHTYGYTNVYELGPLLDVHTTRIPFVGKKE